MKRGSDRGSDFLEWRCVWTSKIIPDNIFHGSSLDVPPTSTSRDPTLPYPGGFLPWFCSRGVKLSPGGRSLWGVNFAHGFPMRFFSKRPKVLETSAYLQNWQFFRRIFDSFFFEDLLFLTWQNHRHVTFELFCFSPSLWRKSKCWYWYKNTYCRFNPPFCVLCDQRIVTWHSGKRLSAERSERTNGWKLYWIHSKLPKRWAPTSYKWSYGAPISRVVMPVTQL